MDFNPGNLQRFPGNVPLPFYMTYPGYLRPEQESAILRDLEYFQQTYPGEVKRYQRKIAEILDKMDYEGSMIYDEYPDRYTINYTARSIVEILRREEEAQMDNSPANPEKWKWLEDMVHVLLVHEIYKRRHGGRRTFMDFRR